MPVMFAFLCMIVSSKFTAKKYSRNKLSLRAPMLCPDVYKCKKAPPLLLISKAIPLQQDFENMAFVNRSANQSNCTVVSPGRY